MGKVRDGRNLTLAPRWFQEGSDGAKVSEWGAKCPKVQGLPIALGFSHIKRVMKSSFGDLQ